MSLNVEIRIDAPQALPTANAVEGALAKVEARGPTVGAALADGFNKGAAAAGKAKQSTEGVSDSMVKLANASKAFSGLDQVFKREADMLEKIKGPAKEYEADLRALDMLLQKNSISTDEYAAQITKMNQAIEATKQKTEEAATPAEKLGNMLELIAVPAIGAGIMEIGNKIAELVGEMERLEDEYTSLENKARKFTDSTHNANDILREQQSLSKDLHTTLDTTIELYDAVRDGTDGMALSHEKQIRLTKTLGEGMLLANKPIAEAGGLMARLSLAMESGHLEPRDMKAFLKEMPELRDKLQDYFHTTTQGLLQMAATGQMTSEKFIASLTMQTDGIDKAAARFKRTNAELKEQLAEAVRLNMGQGASGEQAVYMALRKDQGSLASYQMRYGGDAQEVMNGEAGQKTINGILQQADDIIHLTGKWQALGDAQHAAMARGSLDIANAIGELNDFGGQITDVGRRLGLFGDVWEHGLSGFGQTTKIIMDNAAKIGEAKEQLEALRKVIAMGGIGADAAATQYRALMTTINDGRLPAMIKVFDSLHEAVRTWREDLAATNALFKAGTIGGRDYEYQLLQLEKSNPGMQRLDAILADHVKRYDAAAAAAKRYRDAAELGFQSPASLGITDPRFAQMNRDALSDASIFKGADARDASSTTDREKHYLEVLNEGATNASKYRDELAKLDQVKTDLSDDQYAAALGRIKEQFGASISPAQRFSKEIQDANGLFGAGAIAFDDYTHRMAEIAKEQEKLADSGKDFASGLSRGFHAIRDEVGDVATSVAGAMKSAFDEINGDIVDTVTKGSADWSKLATSIETSMTKLALQNVEGSLFGLIGGKAADAASGAAAGVATGTSASTTMLAAAPSIGSLIGATAAAAIAGASAGSAGAASAAAAIAGSWTGSDTMVHAANGYSARVAGSAGVDTKLFAAMVSPGERITIQTPQQQASSDHGGGGAPNVQIINQHDTRAEVAAGLASGAHDTAIVNVMKRNKGMLQALLRK